MIVAYRACIETVSELIRKENVMRIADTLRGRITRRAAVAVLSGAALSKSTAVASQSDATCQHAGGTDSIFYVIDASGSVGVALRLRIAIAPDGSAEMDGAILVVSALDGSIPAADRGRPMRLVANGTSTQASCADVDGDGRAGLVRLTAELEDARSGESVPVALETERDIDRPGFYAFLLRVGDEDLRVNARVAFGPVRRQRRRRTRRR